jgi:hypothetical protein
MANYFPVALTGMARSWLMNLPEGTLHSWSERCHQFTANFESAYAWPGNETDLHTIQQRSGESLRSFVQRFSQVRNTIPRISNAFVVVAFRQGVRDEKMLEEARHPRRLGCVRALQPGGLRQGCRRPHLALPSRPCGKGAEQAQRWGPGPRRGQRHQEEEEEGWWQPASGWSIHCRSCSSGWGPWRAERRQTPLSAIQ